MGWRYVPRKPSFALQRPSLSFLSVWRCLPYHSGPCATFTRVLQLHRGCVYHNADITGVEVSNYLVGRSRCRPCCTCANFSRGEWRLLHTRALFHFLSAIVHPAYLLTAGYIFASVTVVCLVVFGVWGARRHNKFALSVSLCCNLFSLFVLFIVVRAGP